MGGYVYTVNNKKGKAVDFWIMDKPTPKEAKFIFSCRFSRYVKPKSKPIEKMFNDALNQELKSQMPSEQVAWEQGYEAGLAQGKYDRPQGEWIKHIDDLFPEESTEECPFCHEEQFIRYGNDDNFCPNCGAKLTNI